MHHTSWERLALGAVIVGGYVLSMGTLIATAVPGENRELMAQMVGGLTLALGGVVGSVFRSNASEDQKNNTINTLATAAAAPVTATTTTEITNGPDAGSDTTGGDSPVAAEPIRPLSDGDASAGAIPDSPPGQR
jgi:hypothetical protein